jgi:phenylacetate-CoA ligase
LFYNTAQPLIRYDHGDLATWAPECACGRHLPLLKSIDGRTASYFTHPDGRGRARGMPMQYVEVLDAQMWQLAQVGQLDFEIRYVPRNPEKRGDEATVAAAFRHHFFDDANVVFKRLEAIPLTASGKYMEYVNEVGRSAR